MENILSGILSTVIASVIGKKVLSIFHASDETKEEFENNAIVSGIVDVIDNM